MSSTEKIVVLVLIVALVAILYRASKRTPEEIEAKAIVPKKYRGVAIGVATLMLIGWPFFWYSTYSILSAAYKYRISSIPRADLFFPVDKEIWWAAATMLSLVLSVFFANSIYRVFISKEKFEEYKNATKGNKLQSILSYTFILCVVLLNLVAIVFTMPCYISISSTSISFVKWGTFKTTKLQFVDVETISDYEALKAPNGATVMRRNIHLTFKNGKSWSSEDWLIQTGPTGADKILEFAVAGSGKTINKLSVYE